ncbi:hypothetical protein [Paenibacillus xylaniclasticus]|uniref:hypothetical protein n=1 Tax=Paenibacillus xylaniclasticus TaxID=588083 RepID=UPI000FD8810E|nr:MULTISPECIES: hypothetical protein [Paenibacillus]GFN30472.1 hypothetical protein PCURB6_07320 [Paenibacillus curdlanolyticus]
MRKLGMTLCIVLFIGLQAASTTYAHSSLHKASPGKSEVIREPLTEIMLTFNTVIEKDSRIDVQNEA